MNLLYVEFEKRMLGVFRLILGWFCLNDKLKVIGSFYVFDSKYLKFMILCIFLVIKKVIVVSLVFQVPRVLI